MRFKITKEMIFENEIEASSAEEAVELAANNSFLFVRDPTIKWSAMELKE